MSKTLIRVILSAAAAIVLTVVLIVGLSEGGFSKLGFNFKLFSEYTYPDAELYSKGNAEIDADGIEKLDIDWMSDSVKIEAYSGSMISISETDSDKLDDDEKLCYLVKDGTLRIRFWSPKSGFYKFHKKKHLTVLIPERIAENFKESAVDTESASISIQEIASSEFKLDSTSGDIRMSAKGKADSIIADSTSGDIEIRAAAESVDCESTSGEILYAGEAQRIECDSTSGDIKCDASAKAAELNTTSGKITFGGNAEEINAQSSSGDIAVNAQASKVTCSANSGTVTFSGEANDIECDTSSGDVYIQSGVCPDKVNVDTTSGKISLTIPGDKGFTAEHNTISGNFNCGFAVKTTKNKAVYMDGSALFHLSSTSGDISIQEK